jgi:hypothetical protein
MRNKRDLNRDLNKNLEPVPKVILSVAKDLSEMYILPVFSVFSPLRFFAALRMTNLFWDKLLLQMQFFPFFPHPPFTPSYTYCKIVKKRYMEVSKQ